MNDQHAPIEEAALFQKLHRRAAWRRPRGIPDAELLEQRTPGPLSGSNELDFLGRFGHVHAARCERMPIDRLADEPEHQRRDGIGRVRRQRRDDAIAAILVGPQRFDFALRALDERLRIVGVESNQLVEDDSRRQRTARERLVGDERIADVADDRGAGGRRFDDRILDRLRDLAIARVRMLPPRRHHPADPGNELGCRRHFIAQIRQFEVRVGVDETRQQRDAAKIDFGLAAVGRSPADCDDTTPIDGDPPVANRRLGDGQNPGGVVPNQ